MFAIIGASGNVGYSTSLTLRQAGKPVRAIVRDASRAHGLIEIGCEIVAADLQDPGALTGAIKGADAVQVILPLSSRETDPVEHMRRSIESTVAALTLATPQRVLAISDYGAHVTEDIGMPSIFHAFEARLARLEGNRIFLRSAEHMHNWARVIPAAIDSGRLPTFQDPVDMKQPTIAAQDLGVIAANLLLRPASGAKLEIVNAEGPRRYSASDVAAAISQLSSRDIQAHAVPRHTWSEILTRTVPESLANLLIKANDAKNKGGLVDVEPNPGPVHRGATELIEALRSFV